MLVTLFGCVLGALIFELIYWVAGRLGFAKRESAFQQLSRSLIFGVTLGVGLTISEKEGFSRFASVICTGVSVSAASFFELILRRWLRAAAK